MKIATMVRSFITAPVPSDIAYSPASVALAVAEGLTRKGHEVTFFAPEGSSPKTSAVETAGLRPLAKTATELFDLVSTTDLFRDYLPSLYDQRMTREMFERAQNGEFDVLYFHHPESAAPYAKLYPDVPVIYTMHDYLDPVRRQVIEMHLSKNQHFASISDSQRRDAPDLPYIATVYNGIDTDLFSYSDSAEDYLFFAGRIIPDKGAKEAVQVALETGKRLIITGQVPPTAQWYFDEHIKPYLSDKILFLGMIDKEQLAKYYQKALALLVPIQWEEPFGLTMAEAMACGTPVIAFRRGSVPEVVEDGKTGFIVDNTTEMIQAVEKITSIKRKQCREHVENNFSLDRMINQYEYVFSEIIGEASVMPRSKNKLTERLRKLSSKILINHQNK